MNKKEGYIIILCLMILGLSTILITSILYKARAHRSLAALERNRTKARMLAISGIDLAAAKMSPKEEKKETPEKPGAAAADKQKQLINIFINLNEWVTYNFDESKDGVEGTLKLYIASEQGKIDINSIYDKKNKGFFKTPIDLKKMATALDEKFSKNFTKPIFEQILKFLKDKKNEIFDISELISVKELSDLKNKIFMKEPKETEKDIYLSDIFTVDSNEQAINPWFLSDSIIRALGGKHVNKKNEEQKNDIANKLKEVAQAQLQDLWTKTLGPIYGIEWANLPEEFKKLLGKKTQNAVFAVYSIAIVNNVTQKLYAIFQMEGPDSAKATTGGPDKESEKAFTIKKFYWI